MPSVTAAHVMLGEARHFVVDAAIKAGHTKANRETPTRLLRAYWGSEWSGRYPDLTQEQVVASAAYLHRVALEIYASIGSSSERALTGEFRVARKSD